MIISRKMVFSPGNTILFFRRKIKDDLSQNVLGNMIFSVYLVKVVFLFPTKVLPFCRKSKDDHLPKNTLVIFLVSLKNMVFILENMAFLLIEKLKIIKKFTFMKKFRWFSVPLWRPLQVFSYITSKWKQGKPLALCFCD